MKKNILLIGAFALIMSMVGLTSCQNEEDNMLTPEPTPAPTQEAQNPTDEELAELLESAITDEYLGLTQDMKMAAKSSEEYQYEGQRSSNAELCGTVLDTTVVIDIDRPNISIDYTTETEVTLICNAFFLPVEVQFIRSMEGTYETNRWYSDTDANANYALTGLNVASPNFILNGTYDRNGYKKQKLNQQKEITTYMAFTLNDITMSKQTYEIQSGTIDFLLTVECPGAENLVYEGQFIFEGNQMGTLILNGQEFPINWG